VRKGTRKIHQINKHITCPQEVKGIWGRKRTYNTNLVGSEVLKNMWLG
jgi:hypothetical protein